MAGKTARSNEKRKARFKSHPLHLPANRARVRQTHINACLKKLRKFARYVEAGKMTAAAFEKARERIQKEIDLTSGKIPRPSQEARRKRKVSNDNE